MSTMFHSDEDGLPKIAKLSQEQKLEELYRMLADVFALPDGDSTDRFFVLTERVNELEVEHRVLTERSNKLEVDNRALIDRGNKLEADNRALTDRGKKLEGENRSLAEVARHEGWVLRNNELDAQVRGRDQLWRYLTFFTVLVFGSLLFLSFQWRDDPFWIKTMALICSGVFSIGAFRIYGRLSIEVGPNGRFDVGGEYSRHGGTETKHD